VHKPVLINEVIKYLSPSDNKVYVDCTFGAGGYTKAILDSCKCRVISFDRDDSTKERADIITSLYGNRFQFIQDKFSNLKDHITEPVDGFIFDVGVSSMQLDQGERGFSFLHDGPLDMRMDRNDPLSAKELVNTYPESEIADIIFQYGDERKSRVIAKKIVEHRKDKPIETTSELTAIVLKAVKKYNDSIHPATRTFQALRIAVNDELRELEKALKFASELLKSGGKLIVVTFHSGEDRIVKSYFNKLCGKNEGVNRFMPFDMETITSADFKPLHKGTIIACDEELEQNPRARSAKLRAIVKL
jgi:16S rRNA (cytosine1402-N4)-methyltransferase